VTNVEPAGPPPPQRDPEFDAGAAGPAELVPPVISPESYLRILANPFLGFAGFVLWLACLLWAVREMSRNPDLNGPLAPIVFVVFVAFLWLLPGLFQFHCLDCGRTGRLSRWRQHVCPPSSARRIAGQPRILRGPTPLGQIILWLWGLLLVGLWANAHGWHLPRL
jgi:hypothetical protein